MALVECFTETSTCPLSGQCVLADALEETKQAFIAALDRYTLADIAPRGQARHIVALTGRLAVAAKGRER